MASEAVKVPAAEPVWADGPPDSALVARVLAGDDRHAFAVLVRRHQGSVRALLRRLCKGDDAFADDLAQETFLQAHRKLDQFRGDARFSTWIYRIAYNSFLMAIRSRHEEEQLDENIAEPEEHDGPQDLHPEQTTADLQMDLQRAMAILSPAERAVIAQCYYLDRSHEEAAYALNCPLGTVKSHISRAKQKLKVHLQVWEPRMS
ncbi:sigma-70 family RNA polymerase sigma factor [uncultured Nevskia sp.]|uniref:RNA polymerase sigma factor n=1 Tax=uncultured Nevskia sp. TaxID=228950 RepID=UPI0025DF3D39|nr:sigma-70 family RNA polymerase sigma factor [uncultured Nevskia sp.]